MKLHQKCFSFLSSFLSSPYVFLTISATSKLLLFQMACTTSSIPQPLPAPDTRVLTWHRLERLRLQKLGLPTKYSRYFTVTRSSQESQTSAFDPLAVHSGVHLQALDRSKTWKDDKTIGATKINQINVVAPFTTLMKPTCGYFFSRETDNRKKRIGIPPTDLVKYRSQSGTN